MFHELNILTIFKETFFRLNITVKKIKQLLFWIITFSYFIVTLVMIINKKNDILCNDIEVVITDSTNTYFIEREDILNIVFENNLQLLGYSVENINLNELEELVNQQPIIKKAQVYKTIEGKIRIEVCQRKPIVRIYNQKNESFYIDDEGVFMPLSQKFPSRVIVGNGNVKFSFNECDKTKDLQLTNIETKDTNQIFNPKLYDLYTLAKYIEKEPFWNSQIEQIYIDENNEFQLIPRVGQHLILLGDISDYQQKFDKLKTLYQEAFNRVGWNKYRTINLKFKNQVVCTKR